jgi:hypothetical protein
VFSILEPLAEAITLFFTSSLDIFEFQRKVVGALIGLVESL